jgi:type II secretory pathway pseudopilin PulG
MKIIRSLIILRKAFALFVFAMIPIVVSNLNLSLQRRDQMRNLANMRAIGIAIEAYAVEHNAYPPGNSTVSEISHYLEPVHIKKAPTKDTWGNYFLYNSTEDGQSYTITSYGKDHKADSPGGYKGPITRFTNDIRFSQGSFTEFPEGI